MLSVKLGEVLGQNRHCLGVNGCITASGDSLRDVEFVLVSGVEDKLIDNGAADVVVVVVGVTSIQMRW